MTQMDRPTLKKGTELKHRYLILKVLGQGGIGIVYEALDKWSGLKVAIKELFPIDYKIEREGNKLIVPIDTLNDFNTLKKSIKLKAKLLNIFSLSNNGLVIRILDTFEENSTLYIVMEKLKGVTLEYLAPKLDISSALNITLQLSRKIALLHKMGILHLDIKPDNIFISKSGKITLIDFENSQILWKGRKISSAYLFSPYFSAPELYFRGKLGNYTDLYSICSTLYFLVTKSLPVSSIDRSRGKKLIPPIELNPDIPKFLNNLILMGMNLDPNDRPEDSDFIMYMRLSFQRLSSLKRWSI